MQNLLEMYLDSVRNHPLAERFLIAGAEGYEPVRIAAFDDRVSHLVRGLITLGIEKGDRVALIAYNRLEWAQVDYAVIQLGGILVPIYTTLTEADVEYILRDSGAKAVVVEDEGQLAKVQKVRERLPDLAHVILISGDAPERVATFGEIEELGHGFRGKRDTQQMATTTEPEDLATIIYTSGTTGEPKGVRLTHGNLTSNIRSVQSVFGLRREDVVLSFLPLSHSFERMVDYAAFHAGATIAYAQSMESVAENMRQVRPTIVAGVPRFYEKLYRAVLQAVEASPKLRRFIARRALRVGDAVARRRREGRGIGPILALRHALAEKLVLGKIRERVGGRIRYFISGGAALSPEIAEFIQAVGFDIIEGYGLTETSPVVATNPPGRAKLGTVGPALPGVEVKIAGDGEILVRGPNVMKGYHGKPDATAEMIEDGWLKTGDIGELDTEGYLKITDRKKALFKTSGGKYIAPQGIENRLLLDPAVGAVVVVGDGRRFPGCLIVPNFEMLGGNASPEEFCKKPEVREVFQGIIDKVNLALSKPEQIKKFELIPEPMTIESGDLTPTMKVRRKKVETKYRDLIEEMYRE